MKKGCTVIDGVKFTVLSGFEKDCPFNSPGYNAGNCGYPGRSASGVAWKGECLGPDFIQNGLCPLTPTDGQ